MVTYTNIISFITHADVVLKTVMILLLMSSILSWSIIFQRAVTLSKTLRHIKKFEDRFWSGIDLPSFFNQLSENNKPLYGMDRIFFAGFDEYTRLYQELNANPDTVLEGVRRAMRIAQSHEMAPLEANLSILATVGSVSPYMGLFGTVWGIMTAFQALGMVQQATISMVAPGISESLIATALGLFAAIPAVIAYNRLVQKLQNIQDKYETFQDEFLNILHRKTYRAQSEIGNECPT